MAVRVQEHIRARRAGVHIPRQGNVLRYRRYRDLTARRDPVGRGGPRWRRIPRCRVDAVRRRHRTDINQVRIPVREGPTSDPGDRRRVVHVVEQDVAPGIRLQGTAGDHPSPGLGYVTRRRRQRDDPVGPDGNVPCIQGDIVAGIIEDISPG